MDMEQGCPIAPHLPKEGATHPAPWSALGAANSLMAQIYTFK